MKLKLAFVAVVLGLTPGLAAAACSHSQQTMSCADGQIWDAESRSCIDQVTG